MLIGLLVWYGYSGGVGDWRRGDELPDCNDGVMIDVYIMNVYVVNISRHTAGF